MKCYNQLILIFISASAFANSCYEVSAKHIDLIDRLITKMTIEEKVGQLVQGDLDYLKPSDVKKYKLGSVLNGGNTSPNGNQYASAQEWKDLSRDFYEASPVVDGVKIPFIWGTDAVHGHNNLVGATIFPHNIGLGATRNIPLMEKIGSAVALEVLSTGVVWTFAPAISVPQDDRWGRTYEGFSEDPNLVAALGSSFIKGLQGQGDTFLDNNHILATAKHFAGDGGTFMGIDQGDVRLPKKEFLETHVNHYASAIDVCVQTVMASFNSYRGKKLHGEKNLLTDLLKKEMNFGGFVVGDWNGHGQVDKCTNYNCPKSLNAGVDMYMAPDSWKNLHRNLIKQIKSGEISEKRLNEAVSRILETKARLGLFDGRKPHEFDKNYLGVKEHRDTARQAVRESLVLLKNNNSILPLDPSMHIGVIGKAANEIRFQTGAWTLNWQTDNLKNRDFQNVQSIYESIEDFVKSNGGSIEFSSNGNFATKPNVVISVFGEEPYAEMFGDISHLGFKPTEANHFRALDSVYLNNIPIVSIFLSGRPLVVNKYLNRSNAFIAAWLPGSEVNGISEVIFTNKGKINYDFSGKLPFSWPKNKFQTKLNLNDLQYDPLFEFGYGLNYSSKVNIPQVEELDEEDLSSEYSLFRGRGLNGNKEFISSNGQIEFIQSNPFINKDNSVETSLFEYKRQDDSKLIMFKKDGLSSFGITGEPMNIMHMENPYIEIIINSDKKSPIFLNLNCGDNCQATVDLGKLSGEWEVIKIPFSCFNNQGFDKSKITIRAMFIAPKVTDLKIHTIDIKSNFYGRTIKSCS